MLCTIFNILEDLLVVFWVLKEELVGRKPTRAEYEEGRDNGLTTLCQRIKRDGISFTPKSEEVYVRSKLDTFKLCCTFMYTYTYMFVKCKDLVLLL